MTDDERQRHTAWRTEFLLRLHLHSCAGWLALLQDDEFCSVTMREQAYYDMTQAQTRLLDFRHERTRRDR